LGQKIAMKGGGDGLKDGRRFARWVFEHSGLLLFAAYTTVFLVLNFLRHYTFHTHALDLGYYDQALWNTAHGRWFANTLKPFPLIGSHFSPLLLVTIPLYWLWSDVRVLFIVQVLALALSGLPLYWLAKERWPAIASLFLLVYYLNPSLHVAGLNQLRGTTLAVPSLALALCGMVKEDRRWFVAGVALALLSKEDMSIYVAAFGLYWLLKRRDWKLGLTTATLGVAWLFFMTQEVIPHFRGRGYPYMRSYAYLGSGPREMLETVLTRPQVLLGTLLTPRRLAAVWRVVWPSGLLGLLAPSLLALMVPGFVYLLANTEVVIHTLQEWYAAPLMPILYTATLVGLLWLKEREWEHGWAAHAAAVYLLAVALFAFWSLSPVPPARQADISQFAVTDHVRLGHELLDRIPADGSVSAQSDLVPHLTHRDQIYLYPRKLDTVDYVLVDLHSNPYPLRNSLELKDSLFNLLAETDFELWVEADGYYLLRQAEGPSPQHAQRVVLGGKIALLGFDLAAADARGVYEPLAPPFRLAPGQPVRVTLYWESLDDVEKEYAAFVHLAGADGWLNGQHDGVPANSYRATSWWETGWRVRDIHYFTVDPGAAAGPARLMAGMYERGTLDRLLTEEGQDAILLAEVQVGPP